MSCNSQNDRGSMGMMSVGIALVMAAGLPVSAALGQDAAPPAADAKVKASEHDTMEVHVRDEDIRDVLRLIGSQTQKNIIPHKNVSGNVTADLYGVTLEEALDYILHSNGFEYSIEKNAIYVYTAEDAERLAKNKAQRQAKVVRLNYLNAADADVFVQPLLSDAGEIKTAPNTGTFTLPDDTPTGKDDYALGAVLVVIDYPEHIAAVEALLAQLDTKPSQVLVEATILQTSINEANAFGVDASIIGDLDFTDFAAVGGPLRAADAIINGAGALGISPTDNQGTAVTSSPGNTRGPGTLKVGIISDDISIFVRMLDEVSDTTILSNPKILAANRQPARVLVGRRVGYLNTTSTETSTTQTVEFLDTGTQLHFRPFVSNTGDIRMELKPQVSEAIIRESSDATGAAVSIPDEVTQEIVTNVMVRDGQTIVLGGLFRESTEATRRQVPILGDIPIVGTAFRGHEDETQRSEIIFLIRPTIVKDGDLEEEGRRAAGDVDRVRAGTRQGLLPWSREKMTSSLNLEAERDAREGKYDRALWNIQRSLSLNPRQPDVLRLRERLTGEKEVWPDRSLLEHALDQRVEEAMKSIAPAPEGETGHRQPWGSTDVPREPAVDGGVSATGASTTFTEQDAFEADGIDPESMAAATQEEVMPLTTEAAGVQASLEGAEPETLNAMYEAEYGGEALEFAPMGSGAATYVLMNDPADCEAFEAEVDALGQDAFALQGEQVAERKAEIDTGVTMRTQPVASGRFWSGTGRMVGWFLPRMLEPKEQVEQTQVELAMPSDEVETGDLQK